MCAVIVKKDFDFLYLIISSSNNAPKQPSN
jgi:hypothetical protein